MRYRLYSPMHLLLVRLFAEDSGGALCRATEGEKKQNKK